MTNGLRLERDTPPEGDGAIAFYRPSPRLPTGPDGPAAPLRDTAEPDAFAGMLNYWDMISKWRWLIAGCLILGLAAGIVATLMTTPVYRATATIQIDMEPAKPRPVETQQTADWDSADKYYQTQYELLRSRTLAERVARNEGLADNPRFLDQWSNRARLRLSTPKKPAKTDDRKTRLEQVTRMITGGLRIDPIKGSRMVKVSYESPDPAIATEIANAVSENFINWNLERRYEASASARRFLEGRLKQTRQALEDSQRRGNEYAQRNELITLGAATSDPDAKGATGETLAAADLSAVNASLAAATTLRIQAEQKWRQTSGVSDMALPDVMANPTIQTLKTTRDTIAAEYAQNLRIYKPDYPAMQETKAKLDAIDQQLAGQARAIRNGLRTQYELALNNERQLQGEMNRRKGELLRTQGKRVEQGFIDTDVSTSRALYDSMLATYKEIGIAGAVSENNISFVDKSEPPRRPIRPEPQKNLILFGAIGLALGVLLAVLLEAFDLSMKVPEDVEKHLGLPVLGTIPVMAADISVARALEDPKSQLSEGYYSVRAALQFSTEHGAPRTLLVTSSTPGEGKTTSALAIASGFARLGMRVLLVDADMRDPSLHKILSRDNGVGLSNLLSGNTEINPAMQPTSFSGMTFLSSGPVPPNPAELLGGRRMHAFLEAAQASFDLVVIDAPPVMGLADAPQLAHMAEGVVMVIEAARTKRDLAKGATRRLRASNAHIVGAILTKFDLRKAGYAYGHAYGSGYGYGYGYDYGSTPTRIEKRSLLRLPFKGRRRGRA